MKKNVLRISAAKLLNNYLILLFLLLLLLTSCSYQPEPINYGKDVCSHCSMSIVEKPFATELITKQGKIEKFDSIECLAAYILKEIIKNDKIHSLWVTDYQENDKFIEAKNAFYINSKSIRSPMGMFLSAFKNQEEAIKTLNDKEGKILNWDEVKKLVYNEWLSF